MTSPLPQFGRFLLVGALCTGLQYLILAAGVELAGIAAVPASAAGFAASSVLAYVLSHRFTFTSRSPHHLAAPRFVLVMVVGLALNALFMQCLHGYLGWHYLPAQVLTTLLTMLWNFWGHRRWSFAAAPPAAEDRPCA